MKVKAEFNPVQREWIQEQLAVVRNQLAWLAMKEMTHRERNQAIRNLAQEVNGIIKLLDDSELEIDDKLPF